MTVGRDEPPPLQVLFELYVTGSSTRSARAIVNLRALCERHLAGRYRLEVIDIVEQPQLARTAQLVAVPTVIKREPAPQQRFIGDLSDASRLLLALGIDPASAADPPTRAQP